ncbi:MAG: hypothetical protein IPL70_05070 [Uliginosibacterium sp.]|nr:hypothetical protein [Uliginosibacterium sp.]
MTGKTEYVAVTGAHPIWVTQFRQLRWEDDQEVITHVNAWVSIEDIYKKCWHAYWSGPQEQLTEPDTYALLQNGAPAIILTEPILKGLNEDEELSSMMARIGWMTVKGEQFSLGMKRALFSAPLLLWGMPQSINTITRITISRARCL